LTKAAREIGRLNDFIDFSTRRPVSGSFLDNKITSNRLIVILLTVQPQETLDQRKGDTGPKAIVLVLTLVASVLRFSALPKYAVRFGKIEKRA
jgi:hypothetical protein